MENEALPVNLQAFCALAVKRLNYQDVNAVLDVLDRYFDPVQDRERDCCFDLSVAWTILEHEV